MINIENVRRYCSNYEQIENYQEAISSQEKWDCHHRNEIDMNLSKEELKERGMYYNCPASELIFLTHRAHTILHHKEKVVSNETRKKISNARKGMVVSDETRKKLSDAHKGKTVSDETRKKISDALKGENNYIYGKHLSEETRKKLSDAHKGKVIKFICPIKLAYMYNKQNKTIDEIAKELNVSRFLIWKKLQELKR